MPERKYCSLLVEMQYTDERTYLATDTDGGIGGAGSQYEQSDGEDNQDELSLLSCKNIDFVG